MTPGNPFVQALAPIPVAPGITANSIVAVRGNGPIAEDDDGIVKYTSAHLDDAESEVVIHSGHSCTVIRSLSPRCAGSYTGMEKMAAAPMASAA